MPVYFAYGSNLSARQMAVRCPSAVRLGPARLDGFRLAFDHPSRRWGGYAADVVPAPGAHTWGGLWTVSEVDLAALDRFEGVAVGAYARHLLPVAGGLVRDAVVYRVASPQAEGAPAPRYLHVILEGAREFGLPAEWLRHLASFRA